MSVIHCLIYECTLLAYNTVLIVTLTAQSHCEENVGPIGLKIELKIA